MAKAKLQPNDSGNALLPVGANTVVRFSFAHHQQTPFTGRDLSLPF